MDTATLYLKILHIRLTDTFASLPKHALEPVSPNNPLRRLLKVLLYTGGRLFLNLFKVNKSIAHLKGKVWLYVVSQNNVEALQFMKEQLPTAVFVAGQNKNIGRYGKSVTRIPYRWKILHYYKFPYVLLKLWQVHRRKAIRFFDLVYDAIGFYELYKPFVRRHRPAAIVFANDHNPDARAMLYAAKAAGIPTIYLQHASVSESFPPLEHDLNLLEGQAALDKYTLCGAVGGEVQFIGMPKADAYIRRRRFSSTVAHIGLCCNTIDSTAGIQEAVRALAEHLPHLHLHIRPHPRDTRSFAFLQQLHPKATLSDPATETAFEFLEKQDVVIAGDSSILLEAVLLNVPALYYRFDKDAQLNDYYGFVANKLVKEAASAAELVRLIKQYEQQRPVVYKRAAYYNATIGTEADGHSHELAISYLRTFLKEKQIPSP